MADRSGGQAGEATVGAICSRMLRRLRSGHGDAALKGISQFVAEVILRQSSVARVFSSRELDLACLAMGRALREPAAADAAPADVVSGRSDCIVFLVTHLAATGGHSRVLGDLIEAEAAGEYKILATNLFNKPDAGEVSGLYRSQGVSLEVASDQDFAARVQWLQRRLAAIRPRKTYMLIHHSDSISVAAAQPDLTGELVYFHNCDHSLALGVHIPHALHVDPHAKGFYNCREREGVRGNVVWPLTVHDQGHRADRRFLARGHLTTCTSGGFEKFESRHFREQVPYAYRYEDAVPYILQASGGTHIHIGKLSPRMLSGIKSGMADLGIAQDRFIHVEFVPSLWKALLDLEVDVYVGSFPLGGGRAVIEAMGAGVPLIIHANYRSCFFTDINEVYPGAMVWDRPPMLLRTLQQLSPDMLKQHAEKARSFYDRNHRNGLLQAAIAATKQGVLAAPQRPEFSGDALQSYLDDNGAAFAHWFRKKRKKPKPLLTRLVRRIKEAVGLRKPGSASQKPPAWLEKTAEVDSLDVGDATSDEGRRPGKGSVK